MDHPEVVAAFHRSHRVQQFVIYVLPTSLIKERCILSEAMAENLVSMPNICSVGENAIAVRASNNKVIIIPDSKE